MPEGGLRPDRRPGPGRPGAGPWIAATAFGAILVVLLVIYLVALRPHRNDVHAGQLTSREQAAMNAAGQESANLLSYRRSHFDADFARALAGATGSLRKDVSGERSSILKTLTKGKLDLSATVTHTALVGPVHGGYTVLVTVNGYKSTSPDVPTQQNLQVTVLQQHGKWLVDDAQQVALS